MKRQTPKPIHNVFNDGYLTYGRTETVRSDSGKKLGELFNSSGSLAFQLMNAREEDISFANTMNTSLDLKVRTPLPPSLVKENKSDLKVRIDRLEYDVITVDEDSNKRFLYFYLQQIGGFDPQEEETLMRTFASGDTDE